MSRKISDLPTVTGLTDATAKLVAVEGGVTSAITVDNLAADSAFAGRYEPLSSTVPWITVAPGDFLNSWVNFGGGFPDAQYRKIGDRVFLRGMIKTGSLPSVAFVLPVGYRPPAELRIVTVSNDAFGQLELATNGSVSPRTGSSSWFSLNNISFSVTA